MIASPIRKRAGKYVGLYLAIILFIFSFGLGFMIGGGRYVKNEISNSDGDIELAKVLELNRELNKSDSVEFDMFWEVWDKIKEKYAKVDSVDEMDMFYGAVQGLVFSLGDPYSMFFPPKSAQEFADSLTGEFEGIGAEIGIKKGQLIVVSPLPESPAEKAGLRAGDKILAIDEDDTYGMDTNAAVIKIRGEGGTDVILKIARGSDEIKDITVTRGKINIPSILFEMKENKFAYIRVMQFNEKTPHQLDEVASKLVKDKNVKGIILDLRGNPGGYLDAAIDMASEWVGKGEVVVSERYSNGDINNDLSDGPSRLGKFKTVVLVNGGSASASEIVAGALHDHEFATIIGEQTYGKGSVQDFEIFDDGSALKLTVSEWLTPDGLNINEEGIAPDVEVIEDWENEEVGEDTVLEKAFEILG